LCAPCRWPRRERQREAAAGRCGCGDNPGYQSFNASIPDADTSIVALLNDDTPDLRQIVNTLAHTVLA
jgi:hypothetical protein